MSPLFNDLPILEYDYQIAVADRTKSMSDHQCGAASADLLDRALDLPLGHCVEGTRSLIETHNRGILKKGAGYGHTLLLTT